MQTVVVVLALCAVARSGLADLTDDQRAFLLDEHNRVRSLQAQGQAVIAGGDLAPSSNNMRKMKWNDQLASQAQAWVDQCTWGHSSPDSRPDAGENMHMEGGTDIGVGDAVNGAVQGWFDELQKKGGGITSNNVTLTTEGFAATIGHWSQVVWAGSNEVGCGVNDCGSDGIMVCCQYLPSGNYLNSPVYNIGQPCGNDACSEYPDSTCEFDTGLCSA